MSATASAALEPRPSAWSRFIAGFTALAEAMEVDGRAISDMRIDQLERRIAALEGGKTSDLGEGK